MEVAARIFFPVFGFLFCFYFEPLVFLCSSQVPNPPAFAPISEVISPVPPASPTSPYGVANQYSKGEAVKRGKRSVDLIQNQRYLPQPF